MAIISGLFHRRDAPPEGAITFTHDGTIITPQDALTRQPITRDQITITADARLDNRAELCEKLSVPSVLHATISDAALIIMTYAKYGVECADHLVGDFAFALWDAEARQLYCARDPIGARPFYTYQTPTLFAFASTLPTLLALPGVAARVDEVEIARLLLSQDMNYAPPRTTYFVDVTKLPFGHHLTATAEAIRERRYFDFAPRPRLKLASLDEVAEALYPLVERAVADRLRLSEGVIGQVGVHLSGGVDSSSIAALVARQLRAQGITHMPAYSWSPPPTAETDIDKTEHRRTEAVATREGLRLFYNGAAGDRSYGDRPALSSDLDHRVYPVNTVQIEWKVQQHAADQGVKVLFSGWGGDEGISFNARGIAWDWLLAGEWQALAKWLGGSAALRDPKKARAALGKVWSMWVLGNLPDVLYYAFLRDTSATPLIAAAFHDRMRAQIGRMPYPLRTVAGGQRNQRRLFEHGHITSRMESWAWSGAHHGITYVYPLTDRRILEFTFSLPNTVHLQNGNGRALYRHTMARVLGESFVWDSIKEDTALFARSAESRAAAAETAPAESPLLTESCDWVDVARLAQVPKGEDLRTVRQRYRMNALHAVKLWKQRNTPITPETQP